MGFYYGLRARQVRQLAKDARYLTWLGVTPLTSLPLAFFGKGPFVGISERPKSGFRPKSTAGAPLPARRRSVILCPFWGRYRGRLEGK